jgi:hypothetical protein
MNNSIDNSILILGFLTLQNQIKLYHWQTTQYSRHMSTDKFYEKINELIDSFIEVYQGKYGRIFLKQNKMINLENLEDKNASGYLESVKVFLTENVPKFLRNNDTDLFNIRDEMLALTNQTIYLFTLN